MFLATEKPWGVFWGAEKAPAGMGTRTPWVFLTESVFLATEKPWACFWGCKKTLREARGLTPWFWARTGLEPGLSRENHLFTLKIKYLGKGSNLPLQSSGEIPIISPRRGSVPPGCVVRVPDHWAI